MSSDAEAQAAIAALNGTSIDGRRVNVNEASQKRPTRASFTNKCVAIAITDISRFGRLPLCRRPFWRWRCQRTLTRRYHQHRMLVEDYLIFIQTSETKSVLLKFSPS